MTYTVNTTLFNGSVLKLSGEQCQSIVESAQSASFETLTTRMNEIERALEAIRRNSTSANEMFRVTYEYLQRRFRQTLIAASGVDGCRRCGEFQVVRAGMMCRRCVEAGHR